MNLNLDRTLRSEKCCELLGFQDGTALEIRFTAALLSTPAYFCTRVHFLRDKMEDRRPEFFCSNCEHLPNAERRFSRRRADHKHRTRLSPRKAWHLPRSLLQSFFHSACIASGSMPHVQQKHVSGKGRFWFGWIVQKRRNFINARVRGRKSRLDSIDRDDRRRGAFLARE